MEYYEMFTQTSLFFLFPFL